MLDHRDLSIFIGISVVMMFFCSIVMAGSDDNIVVYPDGEYGIDLGGGYQAMPDGTQLLPEGYRDPISDSKYGPQTPEGYMLFPGFKFPDSAARERRSRTRRSEYEHMLMMPSTDATTTGAPPQPRTLLWGFSSYTGEE